MKVWILTKEYNEYDQFGEYFIEVFANKPTLDQLTTLGIKESEAKHILEKNGGRRGVEDERYHLREETPL